MKTSAHRSARAGRHVAGHREIGESADLDPHGQRAVVIVQQGTLSPALHRLEERGALKAEWKPSDTGRDTKSYRLTRAGQAQLESESASWARLTEAVSFILKAEG